MSLVTINESTWHFQERGNPCNPPLLLLHGFTGCATMWSGIMEGLSDAYRCIAVDLPGHGRTVVPLQFDQFRLTSVADVLAELLDKLEIKETALWGYSMGGRLALQFALRHPAVVNQLILESASPGLAHATEREDRRRSDEALADRILEQGMDAFVDEWSAKPIFAGQQGLPEDVQQRARALRLQNSPGGLAMSLRGMGTGAQAPLQDELHSLQMPTLIIVGEHDQKFTSIGRALKHDIRHARLSIIPDAGHSPYWEQPGTTLSVVRTFLAGGDSADAGDDGY